MMLAEVIDHKLTTAEWAFMLIAVASVLSLAIFCCSRVLFYDPAATKHMHAPMDIDTHDKGT